MTDLGSRDPKEPEDDDPETTTGGWLVKERVAELEDAIHIAQASLRSLILNTGGAVSNEVRDASRALESVVPVCD